MAEQKSSKTMLDRSASVYLEFTCFCFSALEVLDDDYCAI